MYKLEMQICSDFFKAEFKDVKLKKKKNKKMKKQSGSPAAADAFPSLTDGEEDQKEGGKQSDIHTQRNKNSLNLLHRLKWMVAAGSYCICADGVGGVTQSCMRRQCAFMHHVADKDFWGRGRAVVMAAAEQTAALRTHLWSPRLICQNREEML